MGQRGDLRRRRTSLDGEQSRWVPQLKATGAASDGGGALRKEVSESWARSLTSVDPRRDGAPAANVGTVYKRWTGSPLRRPVDDPADELRSVADDAGFFTAHSPGRPEDPGLGLEWPTGCG